MYFAEEDGWGLTEAEAMRKAVKMLSRTATPMKFFGNVR